ncbi:MAG TPA: R3H domain-containing nucleic acid-binding protein [Thermoanaerobaculia bacterium]|nr:R3H domain-containing nucleic acid-binding protein [Thermoanaerobaculia bacterium]
MAHRFEGRNLDEALTLASQTLGVERYQLTYHVLLEKRSFLGGMKRVVIEADVNEAAAPPRPRETAAEPGTRSRGDAPRDRDARRSGGRGRGRRRRGERDEVRGSDEPQLALEEPAAAPEQGEESETAAAVHTWCGHVLRLARLETDVRTEENETQIVVRIYGRDAGRMTDRHGELLDALQVLANKAMTGRTAEKDIELDCAAFKERRVEELGERARATADRVRRDGREELLPAMSPIERRIVHLALADDAGVTTESRGDGFYKRVAIVPRALAQQPEP